ncbi:hypothetical protein ABIF70_005157 [Bradyrhizobium japonicum]
MSLSASGPPREVSYKFEYETELMIVIGKTARNVSESEALKYVAGYAVGHDFSARDLQMETGGQWMVGKTLDGFAPIGPYFVSADLVGDLNASQRRSPNRRPPKTSSSMPDDGVFHFEVVHFEAGATSYSEAHLPA